MSRIRIAVDADGWDNSGNEILKWALNFSSNHPEIDVVLYRVADDVDRIRNLPIFPDNVAVVWTDSVIPASFKWNGRTSIRALNDQDSLATSSMVQAFDLLSESEVSGVFSAGNTPAFILLSAFKIRKASQNMRLALASEFPSPLKPISLWLDMWANPDISPEHIVQYALLGSEYLRQRYGERYPIWSLNIATEDAKWMELQEDANKLLRELEREAGIHYIGNLEPESLLLWERKIIAGWAYDLNLALKWIKGGSDYTLRQIWTRVLWSRIWEYAAEWLKRRVNKSAWALLLWANKPIAKANGNSTPEMVERTLQELLEFIILVQNSEIIQQTAEWFESFYGNVRVKKNTED